MKKQPDELRQIDIDEGVDEATAISSPTKSAQTTESTSSRRPGARGGLRTSSSGGRFLARGLELAQPVLERTAAVDHAPRRMESTPMIVPTR